MKRDLKLKTGRLVVTPMTTDALKAYLETLSDPELIQAYGEMLSGCEEHPDDRIWYVPWEITLKATGQRVGDLGFKGPPKDGAVEVGYGMDPGFEGNGYCTEALKVLTEWIFSRDDVTFIEAETAPDNLASLRILSKLEFVPDGDGEEGPRFLLKKPVTSWLPIYMCLGISVGMCFGVALNNIAIGMCFGLAIGVLMGTALSAFEKKRISKAEKIRAQIKKEIEVSKDDTGASES